MTSGKAVKAGILAFAVVFLSRGSQSRADDSSNMATWTYRVRIPRTQRSCAEEAGLLGGRFARATGLPVTGAECRGTIHLSDGQGAHPLYVLVVSYRAQAEVLPYTVIFSSSVWPPVLSADVPEVYPSFVDCENDLEPQSRVYEANTGLLAVTAQCEKLRGPSDPNDSEYALRIDGFGEPKNRLFVFQSFTGQTNPSTEESVRELMRAQGAVISKERQSLIFYYAQDPVKLQRDWLGIFDKADQCVAQLDDAKEIMKESGATVMIARCVPSSSESMRLEVISNPTSGISDDYGGNSQAYYSFDECMQDKPRAIAQAKANWAGVRGGLCVQDFISLSDNFVLRLFSML